MKYESFVTKLIPKWLIILQHIRDSVQGWFGFDQFHEHVMLQIEEVLLGEFLGDVGVAA